MGQNVSCSQANSPSHDPTPTQTSISPHLPGLQGATPLAPSHCAGATAWPACAIVSCGLRKFPLTRPLRQAPVPPPPFSTLLVPSGRIPGISSLSSKLPRVPEPSTTYLSCFCPLQPRPQLQRLRFLRRGRRRARARAEGARGGRGVRAPVQWWAWPGRRATETRFWERPSGSFVCSRCIGFPTTAESFSVRLL